MRHMMLVSIAALASACSPLAAADPVAPPATAPQLPDRDTLRALGTEPFWSLTIDRHTLHFTNADGLDIRVPAPRVAHAKVSEEYYTPRVQASVRFNFPCSDGMSDRRYDHRVEVTVDGRELSGCGQYGIAARDLAGTRWRIAEIGDRPVVSARATEIAFADEMQLSGTAGCNRFSGHYGVSRSRLITGALTATEMACPGPAGAQEEAVFAAFGGPLEIAQDEAGRLVLSREGGVRLVLVRQP